MRNGSRGIFSASQPDRVGSDNDDAAREDSTAREGEEEEELAGTGLHYTGCRLREGPTKEMKERHRRAIARDVSELAVASRRSIIQRERLRR